MLQQLTRGAEVEAHNLRRTANAKAYRIHGACVWLSKVPSCGARVGHTLGNKYVKAMPRRFGLTFGAKIVFSDGVLEDRRRNIL